MSRRGERLRLEELPAVLTVEEAADVLRIGRGAAYELARRYETSGGHEGLPVLRLGRTLRVPKTGLERLLAGEPVDRETNVREMTNARWGRPPKT